MDDEILNQLPIEELEQHYTNHTMLGLVDTKDCRTCQALIARRKEKDDRWLEEQERIKEMEDERDPDEMRDTVVSRMEYGTKNKK